ncbi:MAG: hypothetical protein ABEJ89_00760 [Haloarculaceae archaeon]
MSDDRAVSDVVAFTLTFGIIVASIGLVTFGSTAALQGVRDDARSTAAEVSMNGFDTALQDVTRGVPRRRIAFDLSGDGLTRRDSSIHVAVDRADGSTVSATVDTGAFVRSTTEDARIAATSGALFRLQRGGQTTLDPPPFRCGEDTAHVTLVRFDGDVDVASQGTAQIDLSRDATRLVHPDPSGGSTPAVDEVRVDVSNTAYPDAWAQAFDRHLGWESRGSGVYACDHVDRAVVRVVVIDLDYVL